MTVKPISPDELGIPDLLLARRVIVHARTIASGLDLLDDPDRGDAVAILSGIAQEAAQRGARSVASQGVGTASVTYTAASAASWFTADDRAALRGLVATVPAGAHPVGTFPAANRALRSMWPEELQP